MRSLVFEVVFDVAPSLRVSYEHFIVYDWWTKLEGREAPVLFVVTRTVGVAHSSVPVCVRTIPGLIVLLPGRKKCSA